MESDHVSKRSKHSEIVLGDGTGKSSQSETHPKVSDGPGDSIKHSSSDPGLHLPPLASPKLPAKVVDSTGNINLGHMHQKHLSSESVQLPPLASPRLASKAADSTTNQGHVHQKTLSSESLQLPPLPFKVVDATANRGHHSHTPSEDLISLSPSSSGSDTSLDELFQVDTNKIPNARHIPSLNKNYDQNSPRPPKSRLSNVSNWSPTNSPATQMMDRHGGYDPYRIPSEVFSRSKSNKEMEWSVASNESLFSLHLGNNSFSRDHIMLGDLSRSELTRSGELYGLSPPPSVPVVESKIDSIEEIKEVVAERVSDENINGIHNTNAEDHCERMIPRPTVSSKSPSLAMSLRSDGSNTSTRSFAFPVFADGMSQPLKVVHSEEPSPDPTILRKKASKSKITYWLPCFSWCKWGCGCSGSPFCSCPRFSCPRCSYPRCTSCARCSCPRFSCPSWCSCC